MNLFVVGSAQIQFQSTTTVIKNLKSRKKCIKRERERQSSELKRCF